MNKRLLPFSITSQFSKDDYARLLASGHCKSF